MRCELCDENDLNEDEIVRAFGWLRKWSAARAFIACRECMLWARSDDALGVVHSIIVEGDN